MSRASPLVGIIMGSQSDWPTMKHAADILTELGVALREQDRLRASHARAALRICRERQARGLKVIIAGAGGAAHLPGMTASLTTLPVLGVPVAVARR